MHVTDPMLGSVAKQVGDNLWGAAEDAPEAAGRGASERDEKAD